MQFLNSWCLGPLESRGRVFTKAQSEKCKRRYKMSPSRDGDSWASPCLRALNVASVARASHCTVFAPELFSALDKNQPFSSRPGNERAGRARAEVAQTRERRNLKQERRGKEVTNKLKRQSSNELITICDTDDLPVSKKRAEKRRVAKRKAL